MTNIIKIDQQEEFNQIRALAKIAADSKHYANMSEIQLFNLMLSAKDLGISPMKAINGGFYIVNGKVCMATAMMATMIRRCGHSIKITEMSREKCTIIAIRKDNADSLKLEYTWEDATLAGLTGSPTWKKYPKNMLYNRCMSQIARILFPDVVGNAYSEEERFDIENIPAEKRPLEDADAEIAIQTRAAQEGYPTEDQFAELDELVLRVQEIDKQYVEKVKEWIGVKTFRDMDEDEIDRAIRSFKKRLAAIQGEDNESERMA